jgi:hypothetical protein
VPAEEDTAAVPLEPPPPPPADDLAPALPLGTVASPPEPPPLFAVGAPLAAAPADPEPSPATQVEELALGPSAAGDATGEATRAPETSGADATSALLAGAETPGANAPGAGATSAEAAGAPAAVPEPAADASAADAAGVEAAAEPAETGVPAAVLPSLPPPPPESPVAPGAAAIPTPPDIAVPVPPVGPPPASWATPAPLKPPPVPWLGPVGKRRRPAAVIVFSVVTLGVYSLVWHAKVNREMADFDARIEVRSGASALAVTLAWLVGFLTSLAGAAVIAGRSLHVGPDLLPRMDGFALLGGIAVIPYLVLLLPPAVVALVMTLERLRVVQERVGLRPDAQVHPVARACLLLLPVAGGLWHLAAFQARLNRVWREGDPASRSDLARRPY